MNQREAREFAQQELLNAGESLERVEPKGEFVAAIVKTRAGHLEIRIAQPAVVWGRKSSPQPDVTTVGPERRYAKIARRFNQIVDKL